MSNRYSTNFRMNRVLRDDRAALVVGQKIWQRDRREMEVDDV